MLLRWPIRSTLPGFPTSVVTFSPGQELIGLPLEVGILLPTVAGNRAILDLLQAPHTSLERVVVGIFAADHFLKLSHLFPRLRRAKASWVCNLPTLAQHEANFQHYLSEIDLTLEHELSQLALCKEAGFKTLLIVTQRIDPVLLGGAQPDAIAIVPGVPEFTNGFPPIAQRQVLEAEVMQSLEAAGYQGPVLCYRDESEVSDVACLCRPSLIDQIGSIQT